MGFGDDPRSPVPEGGGRVAFMSEAVRLVGFDFGTTTSSAVVATARLTRNAVTRRMDLDEVREDFRSDMVFTPVCGDLLDEPLIETYLDGWLAAARVTPGEVFGGGALLTGLAAQKENAPSLVRLIRRRLGNALVATADDPRLESWLAFMGAAAALSRAHPETPILNLDIGGGTTNLALGRGGEVGPTGCLFVGARHVQVEPGTYRITRLSPYACALLPRLGIPKGPGDSLATPEADAVVGFYVGLLEAAVTGRRAAFEDAVARLHEQVSFRLPENGRDAAFTFSGGVGELIYRHARGEPWPPTTHFGDLGIDLARRVVASPVLSRHLSDFVSAAGGRATVYGLLRHNTEIAGCTVFLPEPGLLPLSDLPVFGDLSEASTDDQARDILGLARASLRGAAVRVHFATPSATGVRNLGERLGRVLREIDFPAERPLVLLVRENVGKALGHYVTGWGSRRRSLVVLDQLPTRDAQYAQVGAPRHQAIPISFYGLNQ